jgi:cell filamentation protein
MTQFENWGDYFWPGQIDDCKINKLGIRDRDVLEQVERSRSAERAIEIIAGDVAIPPTYDLAHLRAIHRQLFQDVYDWAGELRVTELVRPSLDPQAPPHEFVKPDDIPRLAGVVFTQLGDPAALGDRPMAEVVDVLARTYAGVNVLHPFVEGNGRTQRIFLDQVAATAGYRVHWSRIADRQNEVMAEAFGVGPEPVRKALAGCVERLPGGVAGKEAREALQRSQAGTPPLTHVSVEKPRLDAAAGRRPAGKPIDHQRDNGPQR